MDQQGEDKATKVILVNQNSNAIGICALIFSIISILMFAIVFMPIGLILAIVALVKKQYVWGICAIVACVISFFTSPTLLLMFGMSSLF